MPIKILQNALFTVVRMPSLERSVESRKILGSVIGHPPRVADEEERSRLVMVPWYGFGM